MGDASARERAPRTQMTRAERVKACRAHLRDLRKAHGSPPPDVALPQSSMPTRIAPEPIGSCCGSPAARCAELVR